MTPDLWNLLHDGSITRINGHVPGTVTLRVDIPYLRELFDGGGSGFDVQLFGCSALIYTEYDRLPTTDLAAIEAKEPELLSVASFPPLVVCCVMGTLQLSYEQHAITLDSGAPVSEAQLLAACRRYWATWREQTGAAGDL